MPLRRLPTPVVRRIQNLFSRNIEKKGEQQVKRFVSKLNGIDHRRIEEAQKIYEKQIAIGLKDGLTQKEAEEKANIFRKGYVNLLSKIHTLNVRRNYPSIGELVIKETGIGAKEKLTKIRKIVDFHNFTHPKTSYILRKPIAYALPGNYVLTTKAEEPSIEEALEGKTKRAKEFMEKLTRTTGATKKMLEHSGAEMSKNTEYHTKDIIVVGFKDGKFIFCPYIELPF
jgi:hypothetical protein